MRVEIMMHLMARIIVVAVLSLVPYVFSYGSRVFMGLVVEEGIMIKLIMPITDCSLVDFIILSPAYMDASKSV